MQFPSVAAVILNTNRRQDTLACLDSLRLNNYSNLQIFVLDNNSQDGSREAISSLHPQVELVELQKNHGYAGNNNVGIEIALKQGAKWIFVLNEDTILDPGCVTSLIKVGERDSGIGIVGPMVYHSDEPETIQSAGGLLGRFWQSLHRGKDEVDRGQFSKPAPVEWISGCAIMVRREVIEQVGMIDPRFFIYWEETEWCMRASKAGWKIMHVPQAKVWHKGVQRSYQPKPSFYYYATRNHFLVLAKHRAPVRVWIYHLLPDLPHPHELDHKTQMAQNA
jgi:GT2 family glycosyltransferase